jgi:NAD(P)-dependent dehydrogenase (short-subunit alcohol dehydrogenase family)
MKKKHASFIKRYSDKSPLGRLGRPDEIAPAISFLLSNDASFITGHNLMIDGGLLFKPWLPLNNHLLRVLLR